jgi:hypothetical protein
MCPETLDEFLSADELAAIVQLADLCNPCLDSHFWENLVARITSGTATGHKCGWDVEIEDVRVEVKFATAFLCKFNNGSRRVFKYASLTGAGVGRKDCDVLVLIGFDDPLIYAWVIPYDKVKSSLATLSVPTERLSAIGVSTRAFFDKYASCMSQLLPDIMRASMFSHRRPDWEENEKNAAARRRRDSPQIDMEELLS